LPNRALLAERLQQGMVQSRRRGQRLAVEVDFKTVNDNHGHKAGDQFLIAVASRLENTLAEGDTLARLGGDEFVVVLYDLPDSEASIPFLSRILATAAEPLLFGEITLQVSASLGVTFYPQTEDVEADQLLRQADHAMYQAKLAGKNRYYLFETGQDNIARHESQEDTR